MTLRDQALSSAMALHSNSRISTVDDVALAASKVYERFLDDIGKRIATNLRGHAPDCGCDLCKIEFDINEALGFEKETSSAR